MLRSLPRRVPPPVLVRLAAVPRAGCPGPGSSFLPSGSSHFPLGSCFAWRQGGRSPAQGQKRAAHPAWVHPSEQPGQKKPLLLSPGVGGSSPRLSFCAEQQPRGGARLLAARAWLLCCCPIPAFQPPPGTKTSPPHPSLRVLCFGGGSPESPAQAGREAAVASLRQA